MDLGVTNLELDKGVIGPVLGKVAPPLRGVADKPLGPTMPVLPVGVKAKLIFLLFVVVVTKFSLSSLK